MSSSRPNGPRPVNPRASGSNTFSLMIEWMFEAAPFELEDEVVTQQADPTKKFIYKDINGVVLDVTKSFDQNGLIPNAPGQGVRTITAHLVDANGPGTVSSN
ncbi:hypothetical protein TWF506_004626 [Arthrobotrys conoides]|uniref:Uncharacterized protein n=1 Tax=Arthrobotrys conoides TaxID=74498 RepID=A0AAN8RI03_9PEZI